MSPSSSSLIFYENNDEKIILRFGAWFRWYGFCVRIRSRTQHTNTAYKTHRVRCRVLRQRPGECARHLVPTCPGALNYFPMSQSNHGNFMMGKRSSRIWFSNVFYHRLYNYNDNSYNLWFYFVNEIHRFFFFFFANKRFVSRLTTLKL